MPRNELFTYVGDAGQIGPASPALRRKGVLIPADRSHKKRQLNFMVLEAGAEVTLLSRTSVFSFSGQKN